MTLQALLVSKDDLAAKRLTQVLANFGVAVHHSSAADVAVSRLEEEHFDQIIVDFDDPEVASLVLENNRRPAGPKKGNPAVTVALLREASQIRAILGAGAHFILIKPIIHEQAHATLRAATAMLKRERRQSFRVPVQAPISLRTEKLSTSKGFCSTSQRRIDVLAAKRFLRPRSPISLSTFPTRMSNWKAMPKWPGAAATVRPGYVFWIWMSSCEKS